MPAPIFMLASIRSGSTLLRVLLDSHSQIRAPHEFHLRNITVRPTTKAASRASAARGLDRFGLEYLLWDRILHRELLSSGKAHIAVKTPNDVFNVERIIECWPEAKLVFLLRHPAAIARSRASLRAKVNERRNTARIAAFCEALEQARQQYSGFSVRYEDLLVDPVRVLQRLCAFIGVPWEQEMLDYGRFEHGPRGSGLGDWGRKMKSGRIQSGEAIPTFEETPERLRSLAAAWGYGRDQLSVGISAPGPAERSG